MRQPPVIRRQSGLSVSKPAWSLHVLYLLNHFLKFTIMKKIFTLMVAAGMVTFASAQQGAQKSNPFKDNKKDVQYTSSKPAQQPAFEKGRTSGYDTYSFSIREKDAQIQKINREYDQKIAAVRKNRRMRDQEKSKQIRMLEMQRKQEIAAVQSRWEKSNHRDNDRGQGRNQGHY
jgi:hypothetical protein